MRFGSFLCPFFYLLLALASVASADELRDSLFASAKAALKDANNELADVLAPVAYSNGAEKYASANKRYEKNHKLARIEQDLASATDYFLLATKAAKLAQLTFTESLQARTDAKGVDALSLAKKEWQRAEDKFVVATKTLEAGNINKAKARAAEAEVLFRDAELVAIKGSYLNQTRAKISEAEKLKVKRYAPNTLARAIELLAAAEKELSENRYDTDYPRALVKEAYYEARHSIYLAQRIEELNKKKVSAEDLILAMEAPVAMVAGDIDVVAEFDKGVEPIALLIQANIQRLQQDSYELGQLKTRMEVLGKDYAALETRLGIQSERLKLEEESRAKLRELTGYFDRDEAMVLTQGSNVLIRMVGLNFDPGSAQINTRNYALLQKIERAIRLYPDYTVIVEGHTDSFGGTAVNQVLSLNRSKAVRQYLLVNMEDISGGRVEAYGYGETRPIANNETKEGRKRNRRIDLLLRSPGR